MARHEAGAIIGSYAIVEISGTWSGRRGSLGIARVLLSIAMQM